MKNFDTEKQEMKTTRYTANEMTSTRTISLIVVHCTGTSSGASLEAIKNYWRKKLKWKRAGYHYMIDSNGKLIQTANLNDMTNGVKGHNTHAIHVAYIGGTTTNERGRTVAADTRTTAQRTSLRSLLEQLHHTFPKALILGHRDLSPDLNRNGRIDPGERIKACPCFDAVKEYRDLR